MHARRVVLCGSAVLFASLAAAQPELRITYALDFAVGDDGQGTIDTTFASESFTGLRTSSLERDVLVPFSVAGDGPASASGRLSLDAFRATPTGVSPTGAPLGLIELDFSGTVTREVSGGNGNLGDVAQVLAGINIENITFLSITGDMSWQSTQRLQFNTEDALSFYNQDVPLAPFAVSASPFITVPVVDQPNFATAYAWDVQGTTSDGPTDFAALRVRSDLEDTLTFHPGDTTLDFAFTVVGVGVIPAPSSVALFALGGLAATRRRR